LAKSESNRAALNAIQKHPLPSSPALIERFVRVLFSVNLKQS
jgi:hypothetical protein